MIRNSDLVKEYYKPGEVAEILGGLNVRTVQVYGKQGKLDIVWTETGRRLITRESLIRLLKKQQMFYDDTGNDRNDIIYARVSTKKQKDSGDLERQIQKINNYAITKNPVNIDVLTDVGSGLNDNRKNLNKLLKLIQEDKINRIFILYKDRLTRFGFNYIKTICDYHNTEIVIVSDENNNKSQSEELAEDIIAIIHSFSGKIYGLRNRVKEELENDE